jgi:hypothetical protein
MKRKRKLFAMILSGMFLAYFSASFIFVPKAPGLRDLDTSIVKLEASDENITQGLFRSAAESTEDAIKLFNYFTISFLEDFHTVEHQNRLYTSLRSSRFLTDDIYLTHRRLQI